MDGRKTKAIARVQAVRLVLAPRHDMAGDQQARFGEAGHAATTPVTGEYSAAEKILIDALLGENAAGFAGEVIGNLEIVRFFLFFSVDRRRWA